MAKTWKHPKIKHGKLTKWLWAVWNPENLILGENTDIGAFTLILADKGVTIEDNVQIGNHCSIISRSSIDGKSGPVIIRQGARIGMHSSIMPNVEVGENAIVGAHSFVTKNVKPGAIVFGVPSH